MRNPPSTSKTGAVLLEFMTVVVLSLGTDQVLHVVQVYPPWDQPMHDPWLNLLALSYRSVYTVLGGYITARVAPRNPMGHTLALGGIGTVVATAGAIATIPIAPGPELVSNCARAHRPPADLAGRCSVYQNHDPRPRDRLMVSPKGKEEVVCRKSRRSCGSTATPKRR